MQLEKLFQGNDSLVPFKAGQTVFKEGEKGDTMFILFQGIVDVMVGDKVVGSFEPIEIFGEVAVIDPGPRSATIVAKTDCELAKINQKRFLLLIQGKPEFALHILQILVERIRWTNEKARTQGAKNAEEIARLQAQLKELLANNGSKAQQSHEPNEQFEGAGAKPALAAAN